jgi:hypothetical protein
MSRIRVFHRQLDTHERRQRVRIRQKEPAQRRCHRTNIRPRVSRAKKRVERALTRCGRDRPVPIALRRLKCLRVSRQGAFEALPDGLLRCVNLQFAIGVQR